MSAGKYLSGPPRFLDDLSQVLLHGNVAFLGQILPVWVVHKESLAGYGEKFTFLILFGVICRKILFLRPFALFYYSRTHDTGKEQCYRNQIPETVFTRLFLQESKRCIRRNGYCIEINAGVSRNTLELVLAVLADA